MVRHCRESGARMNACECASRASRTPTGHLHLLPCCEPCGSNAVATSSLARSPACLWSADFNILTQGNFNDLLNHPDTYSTHLCVCINSISNTMWRFLFLLSWSLWLLCIKYICKKLLLCDQSRNFACLNDKTNKFLTLRLREEWNVDIDWERKTDYDI